MPEHHFVLRPFVPRSILSKAFIQVLVVPTLIFSATAALAQSDAVAQNNDDDIRVHIQPRESLLAQSQAQASPRDRKPQPDSATRQQPPAPNPIQPVYITVPAGTKLPLVLARPLSLKHTKPGDMAYLQTTFPITVDGQMAIPPGTFLQGTIEKITRKDRLYRVLGFELRSVEIIFPTGYTVNVSGLLEADPVIGQSSAPEIETRDSPPILAATGGPTPPPLPPLPSATLPKAPIIIGVVGAVGAVVISLVLINRNDILMHPGVSMEAVLPEPLELDEDRVMVAVQQYAGQAAISPPVPQPPTMGTCWTAGSAGTPDTVIPGTPPQTIPGTPSITIPGNPPTVIPGSPPVTIPGTPPTVIHGTPATDRTPYPCPK